MTDSVLLNDGSRVLLNTSIHVFLNVHTPGVKVEGTHPQPLIGPRAEQLIS